MKKKLLASILCVVLILLLLPGGSASAEEKLAFISINDTLPPELINCVVSYGGQTYVPYYIFSNYGLGISYSYFNSAATAYLSTRDRQMFFDLNSGDTYDGQDNHYSSPAILRSGTVYLPLNLMYRFFGGFSYTNIAGNEYGSILRITTDAVILSDTDFLRAAKNTMRSYYLSYNNQLAAETPAATETPPQATPEPEEQTHEGERFTLSFTGLPAAHTLTALAQNQLSTCFFLTAADVRADPDMVRRVVGAGHRLGVYCTGEDLTAEFDETSRLLFDAARVRTILIAAPEEYAEECRALAEERDLVWCAGHSIAADVVYVYHVSAWLETAGENPSLRLNCASDAYGSPTGQILQYLNTQKYDVVCPRETD